MEKHIANGLETMQAIADGRLPAPSMARTMDMAIAHAEPGLIVFTARANKSHLNPMGGVHGGFAATALDSATGAAVHTLLGPGESYGTVDLNVKMLRPVPLDKELAATGKVISLGRNLGVSEGVLSDAEGKIYAHATATCMILRPGAGAAEKPRERGARAAV